MIRIDWPDLPPPVRLTYESGIYIVGTPSGDVRSPDPTNLLFTLGMSERQASKAIQFAREQPGEELTFSWRR